MVMVKCLQNGLWLVNLGLVGGAHSNSNCPGTRKLHIVEGHFRCFWVCEPISASCLVSFGCWAMIWPNSTQSAYCMPMQVAIANNGLVLVWVP